MDLVSLYFTVSYTTTHTDRSISIGVLGLLHQSSITMRMRDIDLAAFYALSIAERLVGGSAGFASREEVCVCFDMGVSGRKLDSDRYMKRKVICRQTFMHNANNKWTKVCKHTNHRTYIMLP